MASDTAETRAVKEKMLAQAKARNRETIRVDIHFRAMPPATPRPAEDADVAEVISRFTVA